MDVYASESALLRAAQSSNLHHSVARVFVNDAAARVDAAARTALAAMSSGDTLRTLLAALRRLLKVAPINTVALRRQIADAAVDRRTYPF
jgi:hypothetical protein